MARSWRVALGALSARIGCSARRPRNKVPSGCRSGAGTSEEVIPDRRRLARACNRRAGGAWGAVRAVPSASAAKEA